MSYVVKLKFEDNPSKLLQALGLRSKAFLKIKENILTRIIGNPQIEVIVLEFKRSGLFYGEITYGNVESYRETQAERSTAARIARRRDQDRFEESEAYRDAGLSDSEANSGWSLEQLLRRAIQKRS